MSIRDYKITDAQFSEKGVIAAPDTLTGTAAENKSVFDRFAREIIAPQFNAIVDDFADMDESAKSWSAEEAQRVQQENARQTAEQGRVSAEGQRETNETARLLAEENRISAENDRVTAETARVTAEKARESAEAGRRAGENARNVWGEYSADKAYVPGNKVSSNGSSYVCTKPTTGHAPTDTAYWLLIAQKGADGAGADDLQRINNALDAVNPTKAGTKATPADADGVLLADSEAAGGLKRLSWTAVKTALGKLFVPLARKINGKSLGSDVTLTGDDIAMGADDAETLRAAMAKRIKTDGTVFRNGFIGSTVDDTYHCSVTGAAGGGYMECYKKDNYNQRSQLIVFPADSDLSPGAAVSKSDDSINWELYQLALCRAPDTHDLPLASGISAWQPCTYFRNQFREVTVSGCASGNLTNATVIATLPEGFRPSYSIETAAAFEASGVRVAGALIIETSGKVSIRVASRMDYVSFSASFVAA